MAVIQAAAKRGSVYNPLWPRRRMRNVLEPVLETLPKGAPIVVYIHGHREWPHPDLLAQAEHQSGLAVTFCWPGIDRRMTSVNQLYERAGQVAPALAYLLDIFGEIAPRRPVDLMAHSLGARVGLQALQHLKHGNLSRFVCLAGVEFCAVTLLALQAPIARKVSFYNVTSEHFSLFHRRMHYFGPRPGPSDGLLCRGFAFPRKNWIDIRLGEPEVRGPLNNFCAALGTLSSELGKGRKPALISQFGSAVLQNRSVTSITDLRNLLGTAVPDPLSMIPVRTPRVRANR